MQVQPVISQRPPLQGQCSNFGRRKCKWALVGAMEREFILFPRDILIFSLHRRDFLSSSQYLWPQFSINNFKGNDDA